MRYSLVGGSHFNMLAPFILARQGKATQKLMTCNGKDLFGKAARCGLPKVQPPPRKPTSVPVEREGYMHNLESIRCILNLETTENLFESSEIVGVNGASFFVFRSDRRWNVSTTYSRQLFSPGNYKKS